MVTLESMNGVVLLVMRPTGTTTKTKAKSLLVLVGVSMAGTITKTKVRALVLFGACVRLFVVNIRVAF